MPNVFKFADWMGLEALRLLTNNLQVAQFFNTDYSKEFKREFPVGESIQVKKPQRFLVRTGLQYTPQAVNRITTTITIEEPFGVDFEWDSVEKALKMERSNEEISEQYLVPAMKQIGQEIDSRCALFAKNNANNIIGILGTDPTAFATMLGARQTMVEKAGWMQGTKRGMIIAPSINTALVPAAANLFNPDDEISREFKEGTIGVYGGFKWFESMSLYQHTAGTWAAAVTVSGAGQNGSTLLVAATNGDTFNPGDVFNIANVFVTNPMTRRRVASKLQQFVVINPAPVVAAGGLASLTISPSIFGPGSQYQNVNALPAAAAALTLFPGTASPNGKVGTNGLALNRDAFALAGIPMEVPKAAEIAVQKRDPETGIAVRFVRMFDPQQSKMINRWDCLIGFGRLYSDECAVRVLGL